MIFLGLLMVVVSLSYSAFLEKPSPPLTPLSKNQTTDTLEVQKFLTQKGIGYKSVDIEDDLSYKIVLTSGSEVFIDSKKDLVRQLSSLQLIISQLKIEDKTFKRLDFRFEKPIIAM